MTRPTKDDVARQFDRMSDAYARSPGHASGDDLSIVVEFLAPTSSMDVIDIATGPGNTAAAVAPFVRTVLATDIAPGMLRRADELAHARGLSNMTTARMDAEKLDAPDASFDAATCRVAPHHFLDVGLALSEIARVLKPGGIFVLEDSVAPEAPDLARFLNDFERARDATHVLTLGRARWLDALDHAGLRIERTAIFRKRHELSEWLATAGADEATRRVVGDMMRGATPEEIAAFGFEFEDGDPSAFTDEKLIVRTTKRGEAG